MTDQSDNPRGGRAGDGKAGDGATTRKKRRRKRRRRGGKTAKKVTGEGSAGQATTHAGEAPPRASADGGAAVDRKSAPSQDQPPPRGEKPSRSRRRRRSRRKRPSVAAEQAPPRDRQEQPAAEATSEYLVVPDEEGWDFLDSADETGEFPTVLAEQVERGGRKTKQKVREEPDSDAGREKKPRRSVLDPPLAEPGDDEIFCCLDDELPAGVLRNVVHVRLGLKGDRIGDFDAGDNVLEAGDVVVVETTRGLAVGTVVAPPYRRMVKGDMPPLLRKLDANDQRQARRNTSRQQEAFEFCLERIRERKLPMKLIRVEFLHSGNKALFYFSADNRIDFRDLVRDLARHLRVRVEMRQVGVRDAASMTGGLGSCGHHLCCARYLQRFDPVSIRMAKDQNLVLNPSKVSGQCGRLKCCLGYEQRLYADARKKLPRVNNLVSTPDGEGTVRELDIPRQLVRVQRQDGVTETYPADAVKRVEGGGRDDKSRSRGRGRKRDDNNAPKN